MALDSRHLGKPSCFDCTQEGSYDEWRFQLVAFLTAVDPRFGDVADDVARRTTPYLLSDLPPDDEGKKAYLMLCAVIVGYQEQTDTDEKHCENLILNIDPRTEAGRWHCRDVSCTRS